MPRHDVIVAGAGPAGATAALCLASRGVRVLLLEKQALGRDKPCGGGLTPRAWGSLEVAIDDLVVARTDRAALLFDGRRRARVRLGARPVWMVRRRDFDRRLALCATRAGADLHEREPVLSIRQQRAGVEVSTARGLHRARALLLATGGEAPLRSAAGFTPVPRTMAVALEVEGPARAPHLDQREFVFDFGIPGGYAWAFPKGDWWNAGLLTTLPDVAPRLRRLLPRFLERAGISFEAAGTGAARPAGRRIPLYAPHARLVAGSALVIGDAAGLADPLFGEGIAQAVVSGRLAADAVLRTLGGERDALEGYPWRLARTVGPHLRRMRWLASAVYARPELAVRALSFAPGRALAARLSTEAFSRPVATVGGDALLAPAARRP